MLEALKRMFSHGHRLMLLAACQGRHGRRCCCGSAGRRRWAEFDLARGPLGATEYGVSVDDGLEAYQ